MKKSKAMCRGCYNDFYNQPGNSTTGECWSFPTAEVVTRVRVGVWEPPPYSAQRAEKCLSCFRPDGYAMLELSDQRVKA